MTFKTKDEVLNALSDGKISVEQARGALKQFDQKAGPLSCKVSEKGAVSIYGMGRWPVTLYAGQMERLLDHADAIRKFMKEHHGELARKAAAE